jgi:hypothetical protein
MVVTVLNWRTASWHGRRRTVGLSSLIQGERESLIVGCLDGPAYLGWKEDITRPEPLWPSLTPHIDAYEIEKYLIPREEIEGNLSLAA